MSDNTYSFVNGHGWIFADLSPSTNGATPVQACRYQPGAGDDEKVKEVIILELKGAENDVRNYLDELGRGLWQAGAESSDPGGEKIYLQGRTSGLISEIWQSQLLHGRVELVTGLWDTTTTVKIHITRRDWWENNGFIPHNLEYHNPIAANGPNGALIYGHVDDSHCNVVDVPALTSTLLTNVIGDMPCPAEIVLRVTGLNGDMTGLRGFSFIVGESRRNNPEALQIAWQGEGGSARGTAAGAITNDVTAAKGSYMNLTWNGNTDGELIKFDIPRASVGILAGFNFLPVLHLFSSISTLNTEKLWYRWKIYKIINGVEYFIGETSSQNMEQGSQLVYGPPLALPPWIIDQVYADSSPDLRLVLAGAADGAGTHTLKIDFLQLYGLDGWRVLHPVNVAEPVTGFIDDGTRGVVASFSVSNQAFTVDGPGFMLYPGASHRFWFGMIHHAAAEKVAANYGGEVQIYYQPRRRYL